MQRSCLLLFLFTVTAFGEAGPIPVLPANARLAFVGDSITEHRGYSKIIETYLLACVGRSDIKCFQFGWSGETAGGFALRERNDLTVFGPTAVTFFFGMNDGRYLPYEENIGGDYEKYMRMALAKAATLGARLVILGSPGAVDTKFFVKEGTTAAQYNDNLAHLREIARTLAGESRQPFANVHDTMFGAMTKAKAALAMTTQFAGGTGYIPVRTATFSWPLPISRRLAAMATLAPSS